MWVDFFASVSEVCGFLEGQECLVFCLGELVVCSYSFSRLFSSVPASFLSVQSGVCSFFKHLSPPVSEIPKIVKLLVSKER